MIIDPITPGSFAGCQIHHDSLTDVMVAPFSPFSTEFPLTPSSGEVPREATPFFRYQVNSLIVGILNASQKNFF